MPMEQRTKYRIFDGHFHSRGIFVPKDNGTRMHLIKYLDQCGIEKAVVTTLNQEANMKNVVQTLWATKDLKNADPFTEEMKNAKLDHEPVRRLVEEFPDRVVGAYWFNPLDANQEQAFCELETAIDEWDFRMVKIQSTIHRGRVPEDLDRVAEFCISRDIPLFIHLSPQFFTFRGVNPLDTIPFAKKYSKLKIILGHFAYCMEACIQSCVAATLRTNLYLDTSMGVPYGIFAGYRAIGYQRMVYGSDSPAAGPPKMEMEKVHWLEIPDKEKQAIFYDNIAKLVGVGD